jgi:hypothetical protein
MSRRSAECLARAEQFRTLSAAATDATLIYTYSNLASGYDLLAHAAEREERDRRSAD